MKRARIAIILLLNQSLASIAYYQGQISKVKKVCSSYSFRQFGQNQGKNWMNAIKLCRKHDGSLVSMETEDEWNHVKGMAEVIRESGDRWFIGLRNVSESGKWCWLSDNTSCIDTTSSSLSSKRWSDGEPNNLDTEKCVEMWKSGVYNNVECKKARYHGNQGYICENSEICTKNSSKDDFIWTTIITITSTTQPLTTKEKSSRPFYSNYTASKPKLQYSVPTSGVKVESHGSSAESNSSLVMVLVIVLAVVVGILLVVLGYFIWRKKLFKKEGSQCRNLESSGIQDQATGQRFGGQSPCQGSTSNMATDDFCTQAEALEMVNAEYSYAVVRQPADNSIPLSTGMSKIPRQCLPAYEGDANSAAPTPLGLHHVFENVKQGSSKKRKPENSTPGVETSKRPEENADQTADKQNYLYAVVDKTRERKQTTGETDKVGLGAVYAELDFA